MPEYYRAETLALKPEQSTQVVPTPIFIKRLHSVSFDRGNWKFDRSVFYDPSGEGRGHVESRLGKAFSQSLIDHMQKTGIFALGSQDPFTMKVTLVSFQQKMSASWNDQIDRPMTNGGVLSTTVTLKYDLLDQGNIIGSWTVTTGAQSNSIVPLFRVYESTDTALQRNVRAIPFLIVVDTSPENAVQAQQALTAIGAEVDSSRTLLASAMLGTVSVARTTGSFVGDVANSTLKVAGTAAGAGSGATPSTNFNPYGGPNSITAIHNQTMANVQTMQASQARQNNARPSANAPSSSDSRNRVEAAPAGTTSNRSNPQPSESRNSSTQRIPVAATTLRASTTSGSSETTGPASASHAGSDSRQASFGGSLAPKTTERKVYEYKINGVIRNEAGMTFNTEVEARADLLKQVEKHRSRTFGGWASMDFSDPRVRKSVVSAGTVKCKAAKFVVGEDWICEVPVVIEVVSHNPPDQGSTGAGVSR